MIDPFALLGLTYESSASEIKQSYYNMSLVCHPDRGGDANDFDVIHNAYRFCMRQVENSVENEQVTSRYKDIEEEFEKFKENQENKKRPTFHQIFVENNEKQREFDEDAANEFGQPPLRGGFAAGYGDLMTKSTPILWTDEYSSEISSSPIENFERQIIEYKEPVGEVEVGYGNFERFDVDKVYDFSGKIADLSMNDYVLAYTREEVVGEAHDTTLEELLKTRAKLDADGDGNKTTSVRLFSP